MPTRSTKKVNCSAKKEACVASTREELVPGVKMEFQRSVVKVVIFSVACSIFVRLFMVLGFGVGGLKRGGGYYRIRGGCFVGFGRWNEFWCFWKQGDG